jgi:leucyl aminopeptidase
MKSSAQIDKPIESRILVVRGQRVMLDTELAKLYGVAVKALNQAVKRNIERFPSDFMFQLSREEAAVLRSQIVTLDEASTQPRGRGRYAKYLPYAFTEQGVAMLSSVLKSTRAVQANVEIVRAFVRLRGMVIHSAELARRLDALESKYDRQFKVVFDAIRELMAPPQPAPKRRIGFVSEASLTKYRSVQPD